MQRTYIGVASCNRNSLKTQGPPKTFDGVVLDFPRASECALEICAGLGLGL